MKQEEFFSRYKYDRTKDRIGGGGFGNVYKVFDTTENETVALKIAEVKQGQESLSLLKEVELASSLKRHVNIARYTACYRYDLPNGHFDFGILQYYPLGNLSQLVKSKKLNHIEKEQIAKGVISGIQHLHNNNIVHRDLKSANILIAGGYQGEYVPKIADFGLSKQFAQNENSYFSNSFAGGSLLYVAPEQLEGKELRKNVDLWSLGVVLFELFVGETPFRANVDDGSETARAEIISKIRNASIPSSISNIPAPWQDVIKVCLVTNPSLRIKSIEEVQDIVNGKTNTKKDSDRTDVETGPVTDTKEMVYSENKGINNDKGKGNAISGTIIFLFMLLVIILNSYFLYNNYFKTENISETDLAYSTNQDNELISANSQTIEEEKKMQDDEKPYIKMIFVPGTKFKLSETEITLGQYLVFCKATNSHWPEWLEKGNEHNIYTGKYTEDFDHYRRTGINENNPNYPVTGVSAIDADAFCKWIGGRLPTETEWEYAAKGGEQFKYSGSNNLDEVGWYFENSPYKVQSVRQKKSNKYGLYDMSGNVAEWTSTSEGEERVVRGGTFGTDESMCRISQSATQTAIDKRDYLGFRLVKD